MLLMILKKLCVFNMFLWDCGKIKHKIEFLSISLFQVVVNQEQTENKMVQKIL